jgi:hypothetical protein
LQQQQQQQQAEFGWGCSPSRCRPPAAAAAVFSASPLAAQDTLQHSRQYSDWLLLPLALLCLQGADVTVGQWITHNLIPATIGG